MIRIDRIKGCSIDRIECEASFVVIYFTDGTFLEIGIDNEDCRNMICLAELSIDHYSEEYKGGVASYGT